MKYLQIKNYLITILVRYLCVSKNKWLLEILRQYLFRNSYEFPLTLILSLGGERNYFCYPLKISGLKTIQESRLWIGNTRREWGRG